MCGEYEKGDILKRPMGKGARHLHILLIRNLTLCIVAKHGGKRIKHEKRPTKENGKRPVNM